jgi:hypothetical protein
LIDIRNHRLTGENRIAYCNRRRIGNKLLKLYLRFGRPATQSRKGERYAPGPHKSHKPHGVEFEGLAVGPTGAPVPHTWKVMHPGTLVKRVETASMLGLIGDTARKVVEGVAQL